MTVAVSAWRIGRREARLPLQRMDIDRARVPRRLLVVDDDHDLVDALCGWIALSSDWTAAGAYGPDDAVEQAGSEPPDIILLDMEMHGADGFETARRLGRAAGSKRSALLALTGNARLRDAAALNDCFAGSLLKPADLDRLLGMMETLSPAH